MMSYRLKVWTAVAETGSCVHLPNAQPYKKKRKGEKSKEGKRKRVKFKIFNPPSINKPRRDRNTTCTVHLKRGGRRGRWWTVGVDLFHPVALESSSAFSQWCHLFFTLTPPPSARSLHPSWALGVSHAHARIPSLCASAAYGASCSGLTDPYKSGAAESHSEVTERRMFGAYSFIRPLPFLHRLAT